MDSGIKDKVTVSNKRPCSKQHYCDYIKFLTQLFCSVVLYWMSWQNLWPF